MSEKIAIVGAGISGANLAYLLSREGFEVDLFEKARGPGGRTATRKYDDGQKTYAIDHGAQYIDVENPEFQDFITELEQMGLVEKFTKLNTINTYVAVPAMNVITKSLLKNVSCHFAVRVGQVKRKNNRNYLYDYKEELLGEYDLVVSTAPPKQSAELLRNFSQFAFLADIEMKAHFAVMLISKLKPDFDFTEMHLPDDDVLNWIGINSKKPQRTNDLAIIMHTNFKWSLANQDRDREEITYLVLDKLKQYTNFVDKDPIYLACHRWLYARTLEPLKQDYIWDAENSLACCGDYMLGDNIEAAYLSSKRLAEFIKTKTI
jgi:renalase